MKEKDKHETWEYKDIEKVCIISEDGDECLSIKKRQYSEIGKLDFRIQAYFKSEEITRTFALETGVSESIVSSVKDFPVREEKIWKFI
jgi:hypothetical protein